MFNIQCETAILDDKMTHPIADKAQGQSVSLAWVPM